MNKSAIPVGGLYIAAFLILLALAGMSLYFFLNSQSTARDYRIAAAGLLEISEEFKKFIDQERLFVMETVLFFLGSQGGIENIAEYNNVNPSLVATNPNAIACTQILNDMIGSPSNELLYRCYNSISSLFENPDSEGIWKCDNYIYHYEECNGISRIAAKLCCDSSNVAENYAQMSNPYTTDASGHSCHQGCLRAFGYEIFGDSIFMPVLRFSDDFSQANIDTTRWSSNDWSVWGIETGRLYSTSPTSADSLLTLNEKLGANEPFIMEIKMVPGAEHGVYVGGNYVRRYTAPTYQIRETSGSGRVVTIEKPFGENWRIFFDSRKYFFFVNGELIHEWEGGSNGEFKLSDDRNHITATKYYWDNFKVYTLSPVCTNLDYCGALWCKSNNLEIPETFTGVPYYYKIGESGPGYYCSSAYNYSPETSYERGDFWEGFETSAIINNLINLSNKYFYTQNPKFSQYLSTLYGKDLKLTFQLDFNGCNEEMCEFSWVPTTDSTQSFRGRGVGGVPMMDFSTNLLSVQTVPIPIESMIDFIREVITDGLISNYFANSLETLTFHSNYRATSPNQNTLTDWNKVFGTQAFGINCGGTPELGAGESGRTIVFDLYDNRYCGTDPYNNDCNYDCLMQHASTVLYKSTSDPFYYNRPVGYDYKLRPVFRFVETSFGASIKILPGVSSYNFELLPGKYHIFARGEGTGDATLTFTGGITPSILTVSGNTGSFYKLVTSPGDIGRCAFAEYTNFASYNSLSFGCCPELEYDTITKTCNTGVVNNNFCNSVHNQYGHTIGGEVCRLSGGRMNYNDMMVTVTGDGPRVLTLSNDISILDTIEVIRVSYDNTFPIESYTFNEMTFSKGNFYEYYEETEDCVDPMGDDFTTYAGLDDEDVWYSLLCLRGQGYSWPYIIENMTGLFNEFINEFPDYETRAGDIDSFISNNGPVCVEITAEGVPILKFTETNCDNGYTVNFVKNDENIIPELAYAESSSELNYLQSVEQKLLEISLNTSYISLPMKWVFAYRDTTLFNQTSGNLDGPRDCTLSYDLIDGAKSYPDCSCKACEPNRVCEIDFNNIPVVTLAETAYKFYDIFLRVGYVQKEVLR